MIEICYFSKYKKVLNFLFNKLKKKHNSKDFLLNCQNNNFEAVYVNLKNGVNINQRDIDGNTGIILAIMNKHKNIVDLLIEFKADVNLYNKKDFTPLIYASMNGSLDVINKLIKHGADVNYKTKNGMTAIIAGCINKRKNVVDILT